MTIEVTERTIGIWFISLSERADWLASLWHEDDGIHLAYRFRYYEDDLMWDSDDRKSWYKMVMQESEAKAIEGMRALIEEMKERFNADQSYELIKGTDDIEIFMEKFKALPFTSVKEVRDDESP